MQQIEKRIEALEGTAISEPRDATNPAPANKDMEEKYQDLSDEVKFIYENQNSLIKMLEEKINVNLYVTLEYENFQNSNSSLDARNVELVLSSRLNDRLKVFSEIEFERTAKTSAGSRQGEVEVEQGWLEYSINEYFNPRFGVVLVPFGRFNSDHFDVWRDLTDRPIAMRRVVPVTWAEAGAGFVGNVGIGELFSDNFLQDLQIDYQVYFINGLTNELNDNGTRNARGAFGVDNNNNKAVAGRLSLSLAQEQEIGLSGYYGEYDTRSHDVLGFDIDWNFVLGPFELIGEYAFFEFEKGGFQKDSSTQTVPENLQGGYVQANYHFWFDSLNNTFLGKNFDNPTFTAAFRYGWANIKDDPDPGIGPDLPPFYGQVKSREFSSCF
ncbi:MAG: hypothetical protein ACE5EK_09485, partial [Nitrospinales bacterium]